MAGFARMHECVSTVSVVAAPVEVVQPPPLPSLQEAVAPVLEVVVPAVVVPAPVSEVVVPAPVPVPAVLQEDVIDPVDLLEAGPSSSVPDAVAAEVEMMSGLVSSYLGASVRPSTLKVYRSYCARKYPQAAVLFVLGRGD